MRPDTLGCTVWKTECRIDVYKRQGHGLKKRLKAAVQNAENGKGATVFGYYVDDPVSYTHLDVYKRQELDFAVEHI